MQFEEFFAREIKQLWDFPKSNQYLEKSDHKADFLPIQGIFNVFYGSFHGSQIFGHVIQPV